MTRSAGRPTARTIVVGICAISLGVLFTAVARQSWTTNAAAAEVVQMEANGAAVLHPMTTLLSELVAAQSAAVRGERVNHGIDTGGTERTRRAQRRVRRLAQDRPTAH